MRMPSSFGAPAASRRGVDAAARPIAGSLKLPQHHVDLIDQSHQRCQALGVSRIERPDLAYLGRTDLTAARERTQRLLGHAAPVMELLYEQIVNSDSMVVLTDATGTVLHSIGDDDFLGRASKVALAPGANWSEQAKGTNAVGTALIEEKPVLVHADEHYLHAHHFLTCSAAPVLDPRGNLLGVLDVSGDHRSYHPHTMALVKMSSRMIENRWLTDDASAVMRLHFHSRVEFIGTLMEGILAVSADGRIEGANRGALELLGLSGAALRMHTLSTLFGTGVDTLVDRFRSPLALPLPAQTDAGRSFHLLARFNWPVWTSLNPAIAASGTAAGPAALPPDLVRAASPPRRPAAGPAFGNDGSALASLCTGDARIERLVDEVRRVMRRQLPLVVLGETGTGKEWLARAIHADSAQGDRPFVVVHCAAGDETLFADDVFGNAQAPSSDVPHQVGGAARAGGGTLFLDEIDALPPAQQGRLLRLLQRRQVALEGGVGALAADLTVICASRCNLRKLVQARTFREDLYYRLEGLVVRLPPLRERSDLLALAQRILAQEGGLRSPPLSPEVEHLFQRYRWPGNIRQLVHVLRTACALAADDAPITREQLSDDFVDDVLQGRDGLVRGPSPDPRPDGAARTLGDLKVDAIRQAVASCGGNISEASKRLGISRNTIYRKLRWR